MRRIKRAAGATGRVLADVPMVLLYLPHVTAYSLKREWRMALAWFAVGAVALIGIVSYGLWIAGSCSGSWCILGIADADKSPGSWEDTRPWFLP